MKVLRGITLVIWIILMTGCVGVVAVYYILSQTLLNPDAAKKWLNDSGAYSSLAETIVPMLATDRPADAPSTKLITDEMLGRAAKASIKPDDIKAKAEPIVDATYAWLDSKSPELTFSIPIKAETEHFFAALRTEVHTKVKSLPECSGYVDTSELETAGCLPWYVSAEAATDSVMERIRAESTLRGTTLTAESFKAGGESGVSKTLPSLVSFLWVVQLVAMPVFGLAALFVVAKRRATGLIAVSSALLIPALTLIVGGLILQTSGASLIESFVEKSEVATVAAALGKVVAQSLASVTIRTGLVLLGIGLLTGVIGLLWRKWAHKEKWTPRETA